MKSFCLTTVIGSILRTFFVVWRQSGALIFAIVVSVGLSIIFEETVQAQSYLNSIGQTTFTAPEPAELGFVETANGNLHMEIPLGSFPQRGNAQPVSLRMVYDSDIWELNPNYGAPVWSPNNATPSGYSVGWRLVPGDLVQANGYFINGCTYSNFFWKDGRGTVHYFPITTSGPPSLGCTDRPTGDAPATDSTGYHMYVTGYANPKVYAPDGTLLMQAPIVQLAPGQFKGEVDANGNYEIIHQLGGISVDMLGRNLLGSGAGCPIGSECYDVPNSQGTTSRYTLTYAHISANTHFGVSGAVECSYITNCTSLQVLQSIGLPDGSSYSFKYDCDPTATGNSSQICGSPTGQTYYYAALVQMTLPTTGQTTYKYTTFADAYGGKSLWLSSRTSAGGTWSYTPQVITTCSSSQVGCQQKMTSQKPNGDTTVYTFTLNNGAWPTQVQQYRGSVSASNLLSTTVTGYIFSNACVITGCIGAAYIRKTSETTTIPAPGGTSLTKRTVYTYDSKENGNINGIQEWKFLPGASPNFPAVPDRATYLSFYSAGTNIINKPNSVTLCNNLGSDPDCSGGGSKVSQTKIQYDSYGTLTSLKGISNHDDNYDVNITARGNPTQIRKWVSGGTYLLTQLAAYDTTGQVTQVIDPAGNSVGYSYSDLFYSDGSPSQAFTPPTPTNAYLTHITHPGLGTEIVGYYYGSGRKAGEEDLNGAITWHHYLDLLDRKTETDYPIGWQLTRYTSANQADFYEPVNDTAASTSCTSCRHAQSILDSFGRQTSSLLVSNQVEVDNVYDSNGRVSSQSHPHVGNSDPNNVKETYAYDGLDRTIGITHPDGQIVQVAYGSQVASLGGITTQQSSSATFGFGYPSISLDESSNPKQQWTDGFGNVIEVDEPSTSTGAPGHASVTVNGNEQSFTTDPCAPCEPMGCPACPSTTYDYGTVSVTVNGFMATATYQGSNGNIPNSSSVAASLASSLNVPASPVVAVRTGSSITMTAKGFGATTNFSFTTASSYDTYNFHSPSFSATPSSGSLTGGSGGIASSPLVTAYLYDVAGNLKQVSQGQQTRTFSYDGLGRLTQENTPEGGAVNYYYTNGGVPCSGDPEAICQKTAPAPNQTNPAVTVTTTLCYDAYGRLVGKTYAAQSCPIAAPAVQYVYDEGGAASYALGRLTTMSDATGTEKYTYDQDGRTTKVAKFIDGVTYPTSYSYNAGSDVNQITYPSGRVVTP